jgi:hypothetical protein
VWRTMDRAQRQRFADWYEAHYGVRLDVDQDEP